MYIRKTFVLSLILTVCFICRSIAQENKLVSITGMVIDTQGQPVASAKVSLYKLSVSLDTMSYDTELAQEQTAKDDGAFAFEVEADSGDTTNHAIIVAEKEDMAIGWADCALPQNSDVKIKIQIGQPETISGTVVDEADNPIADAEVSIAFMMVLYDGQPRYTIGSMLPDLLMSKTDIEGRFSFSRIPEGATMEFMVKKSGRATASTIDIQNYEGGKLQFSAGQTDIKLVQSLEAKIEGIAIDKASGEPAAGVRILASQAGNNEAQAFLGIEPVVSGQDGTFVIEGLKAGKYALQLVPYREEMADWTGEPVEVTTEAGKTQSDVKFELSKGGVLEVIVTDAETKQAIEQASVYVQQQTVSASRNVSFTNKEGIAQIRLAPGQYQIIQVYKQGYAAQRTLQNQFSIEDGKTVRVECQLVSQPKITGIVTDQNDKPIGNVTLRICPMGGQTSLTDSQGKFEVTFDPSNWPNEIPVMYLVGRYEEGNLAAAIEIEEDTRTANIQLRPAVTLSGRVVDPNNKGIAGARLLLMLRASNWGSTIESNAVTDSDGNFEVKAIPADQRYSINITADGYGQNSTEFYAEDAVNNRLEVEKITLSPANLTVSGVVVDDTGKPVANARISVFGDNQPSQSIMTDAEGKFTVKACEGTIRISAYSTSGVSTLYGNISTEGGTSDVRIVISNPSYVPAQRQPSSLVGRPLPELKDFGFESLPDTTGKVVLVCIFDYEQRPSRNCLIQLTKRAQELKEQDIEVVAIQISKIDENTLNDWIQGQGIAFPVGMIQADEEETRFNWGIRALPWLILTDTEHIVKNQGFSISELDEIIKKFTNQ